MRSVGKQRKKCNKKGNNEKSDSEKRNNPKKNRRTFFSIKRVILTNKKKMLPFCKGQNFHGNIILALNPVFRRRKP